MLQRLDSEVDFQGVWKNEKKGPGLFSDEEDNATIDSLYKIVRKYDHGTSSIHSSSTSKSFKFLTNQKLAVRKQHLLVEHKKTKKRYNAMKITFKNMEDANDCYVEYWKLKKFDHENIVTIENIFVEHDVFKNQSNSAETSNDSSNQIPPSRNSHVYIVTERYPDTLSAYLSVNTIYHDHDEHKVKDSKSNIPTDNSFASVEIQLSIPLSPSDNGISKNLGQNAKETDDQYNFNQTKVQYLSESFVVNCGLQLTSALKFLHQQEYIHGQGQLRTEQIYVTDLYSTFLIEIASCKNIQLEQDGVSYEQDAYIAPEFRNLPPSLITTKNTKKGDVWALGMIIFSVCTLMNLEGISKWNSQFINQQGITDIKLMDKNIQQKISTIPYSSKLKKYLKNLLNPDPLKRFDSNVAYTKFEKLQKRLSDSLSQNKKLLHHSTDIAQPLEPSSLSGIFGFRPRRSSTESNSNQLLEKPNSDKKRGRSRSFGETIIDFISGKTTTNTSSSSSSSTTTTITTGTLGTLGTTQSNTGNRPKHSKSVFHSRSNTFDILGSSNSQKIIPFPRYKTIRDSSTKFANGEEKRMEFTFIHDEMYCEIMKEGQLKKKKSGLLQQVQTKWVEYYFTLVAVLVRPNHNVQQFSMNHLSATPLLKSKPSIEDMLSMLKTNSEEGKVAEKIKECFAIYLYYEFIEDSNVKYENQNNKIKLLKGKMKIPKGKDVVFSDPSSKTIFSIRTNEGTHELMANDENAREQWVQAIQSLISVYQENNNNNNNNNYLI